MSHQRVADPCTVALATRVAESLQPSAMRFAETQRGVLFITLVTSTSVRAGSWPFAIEGDFIKGSTTTDVSSSKGDGHHVHDSRLQPQRTYHC